MPFFENPDRDQIITLASCHTCGAYRGMPCTFNRTEDPSGDRTRARKSHDARTILAKEKWQKALAPITINL